MADRRYIPGASSYSIDRAGRVWSHRGIGKSTVRRDHAMSLFTIRGVQCVSIIDDAGEKRRRKVDDLIAETFGEG